ncbi:MAG: hypothetical protein HYV35_07365 [Lentisphaerae bacterium]|nr:hypothetical protein [Lentisphaerota bacterium]
MSKNSERKSKRYGDKSLYFERLHNNIMTRWRGSGFLRAGLDDTQVNISRDFIGYVGKKHPENLKDIEHLVNVQMRLIQGRNW